MTENNARLADFAKQIRRYVNQEAVNCYMELARQWISSEIRMDQFDRRGRRLNVPIDVHTNFMLEIGELFNLPFEDPKNRLIKRKSRKRKEPGSSSTSNTNPNESPHFSPPCKDNPIQRNELSTRLLLFALTNDVCNPSSLMDSSANSQDRAQNFANNIMFYAGLAKTPHNVNESGFVILESPIDQTAINESDVCTALKMYAFLLPDQSKRDILIESFSSRVFHHL